MHELHSSSYCFESVTCRNSSATFHVSMLWASRPRPSLVERMSASSTYGSPPSQRLAQAHLWSWALTGGFAHDLARCTPPRAHLAR